MKYIVTLNEKNYEVIVEQGQAIMQNITAAAVCVPAVSPTVAPAAAPAAAPVSVSISPGEQIVSPMPGMILNLKVAAGQAVKKGAVLLVLEAMKMENDIVAPRDGSVLQVAVAKGETVNTGDVLVVLS